MGWQQYMDSAKHRHRPRLKDWSRDGFATTRSQAFDALARLRNQQEGNDEVKVGTVDRVHARDLSPHAFTEQYEKACKPVVIQGVPQEEGWEATERWTSYSALRRRFRHYTFKCGEDDDGKSVRVRLKHFFKYVKKQEDDSPLYIFDSTYDDNKEGKALLDDYQVPSYFPDDLFYLVGERRRPPYRWFLVGPRRSGTSLHIDPLGTSAWNTVLTGRKRWVLFPPGTPKDLAKGKDLYKKGEDDEPINYFVDILPRMRAKYGQELTFFEFIQEPGETVFVPGGWWHAVINLEDSVAVTQNFVSRVNFPTVWRKTRVGRKKMAGKWLERLGDKEPELAALARKLNEMDGFHMMTREERKERRRKKREKKRRKERREKEKEKEKEREKEKAAEKRKGDNDQDRAEKRGRREGMSCP